MAHTERYFVVYNFLHIGSHTGSLFLYVAIRVAVYCITCILYCTCTHVTRLVFPVISDLIVTCFFVRGVDSESLLLLLLLFCTLTVNWGYLGTLVATHVQGFSDWSILCQTASDWLMFFSLFLIGCCVSCVNKACTYITLIAVSFTQSFCQVDCSCALHYLLY